MSYSLKQAADATGKSKPTVLRAIQSGKLPARRDERGRWQIEPAELRRVFRETVRTDTRIDATGVGALNLLRDILDEVRQVKVILSRQLMPVGMAPAADHPMTPPPGDSNSKADDLASAPKSPDPDAVEADRPAEQISDSGRPANADTPRDHAGKPELTDLRRGQNASAPQALQMAKQLIDRGDIAMAARRYGDAIEDYKRAAAAVPDGHLPHLVDCLDRLGDAFYRDGYERGDNAALGRSVETWRSVLQHRPRDQAPLDWAMTQNNLGRALRALGERENDTALLTEAVSAFRAVLEERTRDRSPLAWASTQHDLGDVLIMLGERSASATQFMDAAAAYQAALAERTRERVPFEWAMTVGNQGVALMFVAQLNHDASRAQAAIQQIELALMMMQNHGNTNLAAYYNRQLSRARAFRDRLTIHR